MVQPMYESSSQFKHWRFSKESLGAIRSSLNASAVSVIRATFEADEPGSSSAVSFLDAQEEVLLVKLYISKVAQLCGLFRFPEEVEATAISYLKRFYLKNTVMDWHPKNVMLTALFLATKTTNNPISLESYTHHIPKTTPSDVLDLEFLVAQSLGFEFAVWHAHRALWGIWLDLQNLPDDEALDSTKYNAVLQHVRAARLTDAELIYTPSQIATASLALEFPQLAVRWLECKLPGQSEAQALLGIIKSIQTLIQDDSGPPHVEAVREVDRRLRLCKNPEKVPGSKAYLARKAEEEKKTMEKRHRKARSGGEDIDPFGNDLEESGQAEDDDDDD